jgi:hypothetical protein
MWKSRGKKEKKPGKVPRHVRETRKSSETGQGNVENFSARKSSETRSGNSKSPWHVKESTVRLYPIPA